MSVVPQTTNLTTQQTVSSSNTTYVIDRGSISLSASGPALAVDIGLSNVSVILRDSLIENPLSLLGVGIQTDSTLLVQVGAQASIRAGSVAISALTAAAGLDLFNEELITSGLVAISGPGEVNCRVVNFGRIAGATGGIKFNGPAIIRSRMP